MQTEAVRVAVLVGSARPGRRTAVVADWFVEQARRYQDVVFDVFDLAEIPLSLDGPTHEPGTDVVRVLATTSPRLSAADAFVVVVPEYNHSFPAVLKNFIDWHLSEWMAKPVGFVSHSGGLSAGLRAVEQLRQVFAELHAVTVRDTVSFAGYDAFDLDGRPRDEEGGAAAVKTMLDELVWWALALRAARAERPYAA